MKHYIKGLLLSIAFGFLGLSAMEEEVTLVSLDGHAVTIDLNTANRSGTLKDVIDDVGIDNPIPLPQIDKITLEITAPLLEKLDTLLTDNEGLNVNMQSYIPSAFQPSVNKATKEISNEVAVSLFKSANYLDVPFLMNAAASVIADRIPKGLWADTAKMLAADDSEERKELFKKLSDAKANLKGVERKALPQIVKHVEFRLSGLEKEHSIADYITENGQPELKECAAADFGIHLPNKGFTSIFGIKRIEKLYHPPVEDSESEEESHEESECCYGEMASLLDLSGNCFQDLSADLQEVKRPLENTDLMWINFNNNKLSGLPDDFLMGAAVKIEGTNPDDDIFTNFIGDLKLANNRIKKIPEGFLKETLFLRALDLRNNQIETLPADLFTGQEELVKIKLTGNQIKELPKGIFSNIEPLRNIYLDKNKIASLDDDTFSGDNQLEEIRLAHNELADISTKVFENLPGLKTVTLNGNPLADSQQIQDALKEAWPNVTFKFVDQ